MTGEFTLKPADILWILPPFGLVEYPSMGLHTLQAVAAAEGFSSYVFYANQAFAAQVGPSYAALCGMNYFLLGERVFAKAAWGDRVPEAFPDGLYDYPGHFGHDTNPVRWFPAKADPSVEELRQVEAAARAWVDSLGPLLENLPYSVVGVSVNFEQTNAALALLRLVKERNPRVTTVLGGFACEDDGAEGIASLDPEGRIVDHFFSGESEHTLAAFLRARRAGVPLTSRFFQGQPLKNLDEVPFLEFDDYFDQLGRWFPDLRADTANLTLVGETSRGCWWGQKSHCLFCGYEERLCFREKSPERVLADLDRLKKWNIKKVCMADLIMPHRYFDTLLPELVRRDEGWQFYYEQRAAWDHEKLDLLKRAGVVDLQPGIETLSDRLLGFMGKGTTLGRNLRFLRDVTAAGVNVYWNVVWGFPGEPVEEYTAMADLVPLVRHLVPPMGMFLLTLVKFSAFWRNPERYGITGLRPAKSYAEVFPPGARVDRLATLFSGTYPAPTLADTAEVDRFAAALDGWNRDWGSFLYRPRLQVSAQADGSFVLVDTRGLEGTELQTPLTSGQLGVLWDEQPYTGSEAQAWALGRKAALHRQDRVVSLVVIPPEIRAQLKEKRWV